MKIRILCRQAILWLALGLTWNAAAQTNTAPSPFEPEIKAFEAHDRTNPPPQDAILFVGSSTFRKWTTMVEDFPGLPVINRGFGGSQIADSTMFAERIIFPYHPRLIVFYAGDNDLNAGKSVAQVEADYRAFVKKIHERLPQTMIAYLSIKPSPSRWKINDKMLVVNQDIRGMKGRNLEFIDIYPLMLGADGRPNPEMYLADGLHPSAKCYAAWVPVIRPYLERAVKNN